MKTQMKGILAGLVAGITIATGITAIATETQLVQELSTLYNVQTEGIRIVIDGKEFTCTDANGAVVKPMIYNGTTYIPARAVSTAFGKAVYWDGEESTVYLGKMDGKLKKPTATLENLTNITRLSMKHDVNVFDNRGNFYADSYRAADLGYYNDCCEYLLDKKYSKFKATLFIREGYDSDDVNTLRIIGDDEVIYPTEETGVLEMTKTSDPINIEIDISNVDNFKIIFSDDSDICVGNPGFYQ